MSYTLLTSDEIIAFLNNSDVVMNGDNQYPLGIQYKRRVPGAPENPTVIYDGTAVYFQSSDNKYVRYAGKSDIKVADKNTIDNKIMASTSGHAYNITATKIYKDTTPVEANPDGSVVEDEYYVGNDTLVLGKGTVGSADYSIIQGVDLYGLKTSKYLMAVGYRTNITNSANVIGALSKAIVDDVHGALLVSGDSVIDADNGHGYSVKSSSGVAILARDYNISALDAHASVILGIGGGAISGVSGSVIASHNTVNQLTASLFLSNGTGNINASNCVIAAGAANFNLHDSYSALFLGGASNAGSTAGISHAMINSQSFDVKPSEYDIYGGLEKTAGAVTKIISVGSGVQYDGYTSNVISIGDSVSINQSNYYMQMNGEAARGTLSGGDGIAVGNTIAVGYNTNRFMLIGDHTSVGMGNYNIIGVGKMLNQSHIDATTNPFCSFTLSYNYDTRCRTIDEMNAIYAKVSSLDIGYYTVFGSGTITWGDTTLTLPDEVTSYIHVYQDSTTKQYKIDMAYSGNGILADDVHHIVLDEFEKLLLSTKPEEGRYIVHGVNESKTVTLNNTTATLDESGFTSAIRLYKDGDTWKVENVSMSDVSYRPVDFYGPMPSNNHNIVSVGDGIVYRSDSYDNLFIGDGICFGAARVRKSIFIDRVEIGNAFKDYVDAGNTRSHYQQHQFDGVFWYNTNTTGYEDNTFGGLDSGFNYHTHDYSNAFAFIDNRRFNNPMFFGIFVNPTDTMSGFSIDDAVRGYANKPDTNMIYTGGIALGGHGDGSGYGLMKVGDMYTSIASYIKTNWTTNDYNADNDVVLTPGTSECPYGGMPLLVKSQQEYDGTFRIGAGKVDARGVNIKSIGEALSASGFGGGFQSTYGISAYINTSTSTDEEIGYDYDTKTLTPKSGAMYAVHFPDDDTPLVLADPTDDDLGKQFIIHTIYSTNNGVNGCNSFIKYKCVKFSTSSSGTPGGDNQYAFLVPPLPAILDSEEVMDGCVAATTQVRMDSAGKSSTIGNVTTGTSQVVGTGVALKVGTVENWSVGYSVIMTVIKVPKFSTSSPYVQTLDDGYELCYMPTPLSPIYYC